MDGFSGVVGRVDERPFFIGVVPVLVAVATGNVFLEPAARLVDLDLHRGCAAAAHAVVVVLNLHSVLIVEAAAIAVPCAVAKPLSIELYLLMDKFLIALALEKPKYEFHQRGMGTRRGF